jgi:hypothetical protein
MALNSYFIKQVILFTGLIFIVRSASSQKTTIIDTSSPAKATVIAGKQHQKGSLHNTLWGTHYRPEWATTVTVKKVNIDTLMGGLTPHKRGGGRQTKSLRMKDKNGREYVFRSVDKTFTKALDPIFRGTFVESVANDQVTISHPYGALTVPTLADAANVLHANPQLVFLLPNLRLDSFNAEFSNQLYLFEERPAGNEKDADNFGNADDVDDTEKMMEKLNEDNDYRVDQMAYVRARLFDMFISDWGRHEDNWRWAETKENGMHTYTPIPRDRDNAYTKFDGFIVGIGKSLAGLPYLQSIDYNIKDINGYNYLARYLDRQLANEPTLDDWLRIAKEMQAGLTDAVIEKAIHQLPAETYTISGPTLIELLKSRRDHLTEFADTYYHLLAKDVDVVATEKKEQFEITGLNDNEMKVEIFDMAKDGNKKSKPFYSRTFKADETNEVRLYGWNGKDIFNVSGDLPIELRLIGGPKEDVYNIASTKGGKIKLYDDHDNDLKNAGIAKLHLSEDSSIHAFDYKAFKNDKGGIHPGISYTNEDRIFVQLGYKIQKQQWRKEPFGYQLDFNANYSITQKAPSFQIKGIYNKLFGEWNLGFLAEYDFVRDQHFPGIGNNTVLLSDVKNYYFYRNREANASIGIDRKFGKFNSLNIAAIYQMVKVLPDAAGYISLHSLSDPTTFDDDHFAGARAVYAFDNIDSKYFPSKGIHFSSALEYTQNMKETDRTVTRLSGVFGFYVPIAKDFTLAIKTGAATLSGEPEFYQLNRLGGGSTLRGFLRYRFYGKTAFYNQNELQYNLNLKTYLYSGKLGLIALFDNGRVWQPGEKSDRWHSGAGGGIMIAPFNKISATVTYTKSNEDGRFNIRLGKLI